MRVAVFNGFGRPITIEEVPPPRPGPGEILLKVGRCGICGSDINMTSGGPFDYPLGCRLGHEYAGEVIEVGRKITDVRVGDCVACLPIDGCGQCAACRRGRFTMCVRGKPLFGGFGDYVAAPRRNAVVLPRSVSLADGALIEPMACGLRALRLVRMRQGDRVLVLGAGAIASGVVYWARVLGAGRIVAASRSAHRRDVVLAMGANALHIFGGDPPDDLLQELGGPPDIVVECVGQPGMLNAAIDHVRPEGTVISLGMCMQPEPVLAAGCAFKEVRLFFPVGYSVDEFAETARTFDRGHVRPETMVSDVIALDDLPGMIENMRAGRAKTLKVHVSPSLEGTHAH
jgi:(R,R)-butanediol dehydrogenase/meso-butanediol dehydrogenase/diacetyl reductase